MVFDRFPKIKREDNLVGSLADRNPQMNECMYTRNAKLPMVYYSFARADPIFVTIFYRFISP